MTTDLEMEMADRPEKGEDRALIMLVKHDYALRYGSADTRSGLGVGIAAASFARKGYEVDIVGACHMLAISTAVLLTSRRD